MKNAYFASTYFLMLLSRAQGKSVLEAYFKLLLGSMFVKKFGEIAGE